MFVPRWILAHVAHVLEGFFVGLPCLLEPLLGRDLPQVSGAPREHMKVQVPLLLLSTATTSTTTRISHSFFLSLILRSSWQCALLPLACCFDFWLWAFGFWEDEVPEFITDLVSAPHMICVTLAVVLQTWTNDSRT